MSIRRSCLTTFGITALYVFGYEYYGNSARLSYVVRQRRVPRAVPLRMQFPGAVCNGTGERAPSHARFACCVQLGTHKRGLKKRAEMTESLRKVQAAAKAAGIVDTKTKKK
jgi:hypothetical protein